MSPKQKRLLSVAPYDLRPVDSVARASFVRAIELRLCVLFSRCEIARSTMSFMSFRSMGLSASGINARPSLANENRSAGSSTFPAIVPQSWWESSRTASGSARPRPSGSPSVRRAHMIRLLTDLTCARVC
jgi:hypothetical protein